MNTIRIKGSFKKMNAFMKDKEPVFNDDHYDLLLLSYYDYLLKFDQSLLTVLKKLQVAYVFLLFLFDNKYEIISMSKGIVFSFIGEIDSLERSFSLKDQFKLNLRLFLNWTYENKISDISGNQVLFKVIIHRNTSLKTYYTADEVMSILNAVDISYASNSDVVLMLH